MNKLDIAAYAGLSPTFTNWFEENPGQCLKELYSFYKMKPIIEDTLEIGGEDDLKKLLENIKNCFVREELF